MDRDDIMLRDLNSGPFCEDEAPTLCQVCGEAIDVELHDVIWEAGYRITTKAWHRVCRESLS